MGKILAGFFGFLGLVFSLIISIYWILYFSEKGDILLVISYILMIVFTFAGLIAKAEGND